MTSERTDYGYDVVCTGSYKHFKPKVISRVEFGEQESGIVLTIDGIAQIYDFVTDEVLNTSCWLRGKEPLNDFARKLRVAVAGALGAAD
jgi:hypothetical protein